MSKKTLATIFIGATGIAIYLLRRSTLTKKRSLQKRVDEWRSSTRSTPYPYEYSL